ncbi:unnamed protein product [Dimorphilus gyrociliatus]|uniref:Glucosamine 6-phosphate N-acetyltransferase n=1 Tax=Dimorphilus gyrociliatus TaxID=2664684 RepID=A0A7I8VZW6_9ANNE|nr:unnamed protein product [Dimorphilus gyrociliatus]
MTNFEEPINGTINYLFDPNILEEIDWSKIKCNFQNGVSYKKPGDGLVVRPLRDDDIHRDYLLLMSQLTKVGIVTEEQFKKRFEDMKRCEGTYYILVIEDKSTNKIVGSSSLIFEQKFIHSAGQRGRIEDVVVNGDYRGKQLGKLLVQLLVLLGELLGVYKLSLECKHDKVGFYENFGFAKDDQAFMIRRFIEKN